MSIKKARSGGFGQLNRSFPLWDLGAELYWHASAPTYVQCRGGITVPTYTMNDGAAQTAPYLGYDPGKGQYIRYSDTAIQMPKCGLFHRTRTNYWDTSEQNSRGFTFDAALTTDYSINLPPNHILDPVSNTVITKVCHVTNSSGSAKFMEQSNATGIITKRAFIVLVKRADGTDISAADLTVWISTASAIAGGSTNVAGTTRYRRCRDDGWFEVFADTTDATATLYFALQIEDGADLYIECPNIVDIDTGIDAPYILNTTDSATNRTWRSSAMTIKRPDATAVGMEGFPTCGWMAASIVTPFDATTFALATGRQINWEIDVNNYICLGSYATNKNEASQCMSAAASQWFLNSTTGAYTTGGTYGCVVVWSRRGTTTVASLYVNGVLQDTDTNWALPAGIAPATIQLGRDSVGSSADMWVQQVAIGRQGISGTEAAQLSLWMAATTCHTLPSNFYLVNASIMSSIEFDLLFSSQVRDNAELVDSSNYVITNHKGLQPFAFGVVAASVVRVDVTYARDMSIDANLNNAINYTLSRVVEPGVFGFGVAIESVSSLLVTYTHNVPANMGLITQNNYTIAKKADSDLITFGVITEDDSHLLVTFNKYMQVNLALITGTNYGIANFPVVGPVGFDVLIEDEANLLVTFDKNMLVNMDLITTTDYTIANVPDLGPVGFGVVVEDASNLLVTFDKNMLVNMDLITPADYTIASVADLGPVGFGITVEDESNLLITFDKNMLINLDLIDLSNYTLTS